MTQKLKWVKDSVGIYWTSTRDFIHSLHYDEEDKNYVWYRYDLEDFEELKREVLFPPIYSYDVVEAKNIREAQKYVEEQMSGYIEPAHPELVEELVKAREKAYKELKKFFKKFR